MIHMVVGKPRNGKGLYCMRKIVEQLRDTKRHVVTNMVLHLDVLQDYLHAQGINVHVRDRVTLIDPNDIEAMRWFFCIRDNGRRLEKPPGFNEKKSEVRVDYTPLAQDPFYRVNAQLVKDDGSPGDLSGIFYCIDEAHTIWPARGWSGTSEHVIFHMSQHAKLNEEIIFQTQSVKMVDSVISRLAQDFVYCTNHRIQKFGKFRGSNKFTARTYQGPVQSASEETLNVEEYPLDLALAACYDTSAGVGMSGGSSADKGQRATGWPLWSIWAGLAAAVVLAFVGFRYGLPSITNKILAPGLSPKGSGISSVIPQAQTAQSVPGRSAFQYVEDYEEKGYSVPPGLKRRPQSVKPSETQGESVRIRDADTRKVTGYAVLGNRFRVVLSDGTVITEADRIVLAIDSAGVLLTSGDRLQFVPQFKPKLPNPETQLRRVPVDAVPVVAPDSDAESAAAAASRASGPLFGSPSVRKASAQSAGG